MFHPYQGINLQRFPKVSRCRCKRVNSSELPRRFKKATHIDWTLQPGTMRFNSAIVKVSWSRRITSSWAVFPCNKQLKKIFGFDPSASWLMAYLLISVMSIVQSALIFWVTEVCNNHTSSVHHQSAKFIIQKKTCWVKFCWEETPLLERPDESFRFCIEILRPALPIFLSTPVGFQQFLRMISRWKDSLYHPSKN